MDITADPLLFGHDPTPGIVAIEPGKDGELIRLRRVDGALVEEKLPHHPFLLLPDATLVEGFGEPTRVTILDGEGYYRVRVDLDGWKAAKSLEKHAKARARELGLGGEVCLFLTDPVHQHLLVTGQTLFKGMRWEDVHRLQLDIEVTCDPAFEFPHADRESDRIIVISVCDNRGWEEVITARTREGVEFTEKAMLERLMAALKERDPDVIEGHNVFNFDLPYIEARCKRHKVPFALGRKAKVASSHPSRLQIAERTVAYDKYTAWGRHIVDTLHLAQLYDLGSRSLESYGLKDVARQLGLAAEDRTYIEGSEIGRVFETDVGRVLDYALDDVKEARAIGEVLGQSYFVQTQIFPYALQNVIVRGQGTRIDSLFLREWLRLGRAVPAFPEGRSFAGGYTDVFEQGIVRRVLHCDVQSLYPSIMLSFQVAPAADDLGVFLRMLRDLRAFRLEAKRRKAAAPTEAERAWMDALQGTFKILINSFYGYLGARGHFADPAAAAKVTEIGRDLLHQMVTWLGEAGCRVIEADTDGIYFSVPDTLPAAEEEALVARLSATLPVGIELELDGRYPAMFSYKSKNYALLTEEGGLVIKGSGLKSRSVERFQRDFMAELFRLMLLGRGAEAGDLYRRVAADIRAHRWKPRDFCRKETLNDSLAVYSQKKAGKDRSASAPYELALASGRTYQPGDAITYYVAGTSKKVKVYEAARMASAWDPERPDENTAYYLAKLDELYKKFEPFIVEAGGPPLPGDDAQQSLL